MVPLIFGRGRGLRALTGLAVLVTLFGASPLSAQGGGAGASLAIESAEKGRYIVVFRDTVDNPGRLATALARRHGFSVRHSYSTALKGFSATLPDGALNALSRDPRVAYVETDHFVRAFAQSVPTGVRRVFADTVQAAGGGVLIDGFDDLRVDVDVAVLDTGIADHPDLNVAGRTNCTGGPNNTNCKDGSGNDANGHGTHVAGTIGALDNDVGVVGIAPGARLWSVKVLKNNGSGFISNIVGGLDWVAAKAGTADAIEVANMSLGCECTSQALDTAITTVVDIYNVTVVVAAGNDSRDASAFSPANHPRVITVSAIVDFDGLPGSLGIPTCIVALDDMFAGFSNFGSVIDITAPGACIESTWNDGGYATLNGTSMASPHVAGAAALLAASGMGDPDTIRNALLTNGNFGWVDISFDGTQEPLLDTSNTTVFQPATVAGGGAGGTPNTAPTVSITSPADSSTFANGSSITFSATASDAEDGDLGASTTWKSDQDGALGTGSSITVTLSSDKVHVITALATDSAGASADNSITVTVGTPAPPPASGSMYVGGIELALGGPSLNTTVTVLQTPAGDPVSGATVGPVLLINDTNGDGVFDPSGTCDLDNLLGANGRDDCWDFVPLDTNAKGQTSYKLLAAPAGDFKFEVFDINHTSLTYDPTLDQGNPSCLSGTCP